MIGRGHCVGSKCQLPSTRCRCPSCRRGHRRVCAANLIRVPHVGAGRCRRPPLPPAHWNAPAGSSARCIFGNADLSGGAIRVAIGAIAPRNPSRTDVHAPMGVRVAFVRRDGPAAMDAGWRDAMATWSRPETRVRLRQSHGALTPRRTDFHATHGRGEASVEQDPFIVQAGTDERSSSYPSCLVARPRRLKGWPGGF